MLEGKPDTSPPAGEKVFVSWSGGKDSYLSLLKAREAGLEVCRLLNFADESGISRSHGLPAALLHRQAGALGFNLETEAVTWESYESGFIAAVGRLNEEGVTGGVFGDVCLEEHRDWIEKMCARCGIAHHLPLWGMEELRVSEELLDRRARAILVTVRSDLVDASWLGRPLDKTFLDYCAERNLSPCGEGGEFHTFVVDGPLFREPLAYRIEGVEHLAQHVRLKLAPAG